MLLKLFILTVGILCMVYALIYFKIDKYFGKIWLAISLIYIVSSIFKYSSYLMIIIFVISRIFDIYLINQDDHKPCSKYLIVLGNALINNKISPILKNRLDKTIEVINNDTILILCGGLTSTNTISEAKVMKKYLLDEGIKNEILLEDQSKTTYENIENVIKLYPNLKNEAVTVLSSEYHLKRSKLLLKSAGVKDVKCIFSKTPLIYLPNQLFKEKYILITHKK